MGIQISILDQTPRSDGQTSAEAFSATLQLARQAEAWGFKRYWVSEHHDSHRIISAAPEILLAYLAAHTSTIQLASGGVMLQHYSPYKVAEQFHELSVLSGGRIGLGIGKAPGGLQASTGALQENQAEKPDFDQKMETLVHFLRGDFPENHPYAALSVQPEAEHEIPVFLLGGSVESARLAARLGVEFVYSYFINGDEGLLKAAHAAYLDHCRNTGRPAKFHLASIIATTPSVEEAKKYKDSGAGYKVVLEDGRKVNLGSKAQVEKYLESVSQPYRVIEQKPGIITGTEAKVADKLRDFHEKYGIEEFIALSPIEDLDEKLASYGRLAAAVHEINKQLIGNGVG
ncbi:MsnO8 family LLM class oxidoreductase [Heyndrickxia coagulans]|uniref:Luciferase-like domain-containing protein n=1 Tax=Heyndrickxia coagulans TaxID=1398 RepID=A0A150JYA6_HEYCO|nr:MsnO8 family LLM class oxidoreductase [Heyndrickxia coagulans]KYC62207.1 hypothetical protein B4099_1934 [Heyndrickxia coagulans]